MEMPSTRGMKIVPFEVPAEWLVKHPMYLIADMEAWAAKNLKHPDSPSHASRKCAAVGNYLRAPEENIHDRVRLKHEGPALGQFWIIMHGVYDTGRPRIQVYLRETFAGRITVWNLEDDALVQAVESSHHLVEEYVRVFAQPGYFDWHKKYEATVKQNPLDDKVFPAVRADELFKQCVAMGRKLSFWLASNLTVVEERGGEPVNLNPAFERYLRTNIVWYALAPEVLEQAKAHLNNPDEVTQPNWRDMSIAFSNTNNALRRSKRIATPEQVALYERLKKSCDYIDNLDPSERPIHVPNLVGIQTRWLNEIREPIQSFAK